MRLVELLREHPRARLDELLPAGLVRRFGLRGDARAAETLSGRYAELLWRVVGADELAGPLAAETFRRRAAAATDDFRELVSLLRGGGTLVVFPEGRPSPDGALGPMQRGLAALVRRARPAALRPLAFAYDPLTRGRPYACVGVGPLVEPPADAGAVLALLRRTTPLTAGQLVAAGTADRADEEIDAALAEGRPVVPELLDPARRRARLAEARVAADRAPLERLSREYESARA
jgi:1-acyl-sn-glycerol-3-phosphate acyltransferase